MDFGIFKNKTNNKEWCYVPFDKNGSIQIEGVNPYDYKWENTGHKAWVHDPLYNQHFSFVVWKINVDGKEIKFASGEFSMGCEGFFIAR